MTITNTPFTATILGSPRIGPNRELKRAIEGYWAGRIQPPRTRGRRRRHPRVDTLAQLHAAGLDSIPVNTFSYYDQMLDTAVMLGALPPRVAGIDDELDRYFAAARGTDEIAPLEMTKWFDTNYHYIVPEIGPATTFALNPAKVLGELEEAKKQGIPARPVIVGPITFLALSKAVDGAGAPDRTDRRAVAAVRRAARVAGRCGRWMGADRRARPCHRHRRRRGRTCRARLRRPRRDRAPARDFRGDLLRRS